MAGHIEAGWQSYREKVVPKTAGPAQVTETQRAFYAGASFLLAQLMLRLDPADGPMDEDLAMMDGIHDELVAFMKTQVGRGA